MAGREKCYELLDIPKFALPDILTLKAENTATKLSDERIKDNSFMSYGQIWPRVDLIFRGYATDEYIASEFSTYKTKWKNNVIREAFLLLRDQFAGRGAWYRAANVRRYVLGCWFKTSIKGFWVHDGQVHAVLINCRKGQPLSESDVRFLARGIYELHCIDDPNNPIPLIVDLGFHSEDEIRKARVREVPVEEAVSLEVFESSLREFLVASNMAGISQPPPQNIEHILDLFRR